MRRPLLASGLVALIALSAAPASAGWLSDWWQSRIVGTGLDAVTTPGQPVAVDAKFERSLVSYLRPDLGGLAVDFAFAGTTFRATTDREGIASISLRSSQVGAYPFTASAAGKPRSKPGAARLFVLDPARPVVIVDIDETLSHMASWEVPLRGDVAPTYPHAVSLMHELARGYTIVYLTARDDALDAITRAFLARHGFPDGPVLFNDWGFTTAAERAQLKSSNHGTFKLALINSLVARGVNVAFGIGNAETDAYAYENAGLPSFIRTTAVGTGPSFRFTDYSTLRLELIARGLL